jgi:hypothetical protein
MKFFTLITTLLVIMCLFPEDLEYKSKVTMGFLESGPRYSDTGDVFDASIGTKCRDAPVAVKLSGGLGNHLFGVAAGIELSIRRAGSIAGLFLIKVDDKDYRAHQVHPLSNSIFSRFKFVESEDDLARQSSLNGGSSKLIFTNSQTIGNDYHWSRWCQQTIDEFLQWVDVPCGTPQIIIGLPSNKDFLFVSGPILKRLFAVPEEVSLSMRNKYLWASNQKVGLPWAIHIRRGDFLKSNSWHNVPPLSYFEDASSMMISHLQKLGHGGGQVFVFSDDFEWVRTQDFFLTLENVVFVDESDTLTVFYYLTLAAEGGIVCSASTFCWWSAYLSDLGRISDRLAIFPNKIDKDHSFNGNMSFDDCGSVLRMPYMTVLTNY